MNAKLVLFRLIVFFLLYTPAVFSQSNFDTDKFSNLKLQLDKKYFLPGETVFFNTCFLSNDTMQNKSCTVVLIDENKKIIHSKELLFNNSRASSFFVLPAVDTAGYYTIQYYLNSFGSPVIHSVYIFSALNGVYHMPAKKLIPEVDFYPEGDNLVEGLPAIVYCKFSGLPASYFPLTCKVKDAVGDSITSFTTTTAGAGRIELNEALTKPVYLTYQYLNQSNQQEIPVVFSKTNKAILNLYPVTDAVVYRIRTLVSDSFLLKVENEGSVYYYGAMFLNEGDDFARPLKLSQLKTGINIFRLFDRAGKEISSRAFYNDQPGDDSLQVKTARVLKDTELQVELDKKLSGIFSVSVKHLHAGDANRIKYAVEQDQRAADDINLQTMAAAKKLTIPKPADSLCIALQDDNGGSLIADAGVNLVVRTAGDNFLIAKKTNSNGQVFLNKSDITDSAVISFFPADKTKSKLVITGSCRTEPIFTDSSSYVPGTEVFQATESQEQVQYLNALSISTFKSKTLQEVVLKTKSKYRSKIDSIEQTYASGIFISGVHNVAKFDLINDYGNQLFGDVGTFLSGRIIRMSTTNNAAVASLDGYNIYLDENLIDAVMAKNIQMADVAFISVMGRNFLTMSSYGPTVLIYTKKGKSPEQSKDEATARKRSLKIKGFATGNEYFNSIFDNKLVDDRYRNTLYWNSDMILNNTSELQLKLAVKPVGPVEISIMGFDDTGEFVSVKKVIGAVE